MPDYLLSVHTSPETFTRRMTDEEMQRGFARVNALEAEMRAAARSCSAVRLDGPDRAGFVQPSKKRIRTTDGPYAETKEFLGGFYIIEAATSTRRPSWAARSRSPSTRPSRSDRSPGSRRPDGYGGALDLPLEVDQRLLAHLDEPVPWTVQVDGERQHGTERDDQRDGASPGSAVLVMPAL